MAHHAEARGAVVVAPGDARGGEGPGAEALVGVHVRRQPQGELRRVGQQPAQEPAEGLGGPHRRPLEPALAGEERRTLGVGQARVDVQAAAGEVLVPLGHEGDRGAPAGRDLLGRELVDHVPVRHLERRRVAQVDLVLAGAPLALAELHRDAGGVDQPANRPDHRLREAAGEHVVVLDVVLALLEVAPALRVGHAVVVAEEEELELASHLGEEAALGGALELPGEDRARCDLDRLAAALAHRVAEHQGRALEPGGVPQGAHVGHGVQVAVARLPAREGVAGRGVHLHVAGQQVVAGVHAVGGDLVQEEAAVDALADQAPVEIRERRDHRVDAALGHLALEAVEVQHSGNGSRHADSSPSTS